MRTIIILLCCASAVSAQRYGGTIQNREVTFWIDGTEGSSSHFRPTLPAVWDIELSVDDSQNVTFHKFEMNASGHLDLVQHNGNVYLDVAVKTAVIDPPATLDLNPIGLPDVENSFAIKPFYLPLMDVNGTYVNRSFESQFSGVFDAGIGSLEKNFGLNFSNFPEELTLFGFNNFAYSYIGPVALEPELNLNRTSFEYHFGDESTLKLLPLPPDPLTDPLGDSNHDGRFDSGDLVTVFQAGQYEDSVLFNSTWETGDWNGDKEFDSGDLVSAFTAGEYVNEAVAVPEPASVLMVVGAFLWAARRMIR